MRVYELSAQNRILSLSENWDPFARSNGGADALTHRVRGRPIWDFVSGLDTRSYLNALLFATRNAGRKVSVCYRCDGMTERRLYQLQIEPLEHNALRLSHLPLEIRPRRKAAAPPPLGALACCGQCLRWRQGRTWEEADIHHALAPQDIDFAVCPDCRAEAQRAIEGLRCLRAVH